MNTGKEGLARNSQLPTTGNAKHPKARELALIQHKRRAVPVLQRPCVARDLHVDGPLTGAEWASSVETANVFLMIPRGECLDYVLVL